MSAKDVAFTNAEKIAKAIEGKIPKHKSYVRLVEASDFSFVEIALRPEGGSHLNDITVAYSQQFFEGAVGDQLKPRAKRVFADIKLHMGIA